MKNWITDVCESVPSLCNGTDKIHMWQNARQTRIFRTRTLPSGRWVRACNPATHFPQVSLLNLSYSPVSTDFAPDLINLPHGAWCDAPPNMTYCAIVALSFHATHVKVWTIILLCYSCDPTSQPQKLFRNLTISGFNVWPLSWSCT